MTLYICSTYYHVYVTLLKRLAGYEVTDCVICDDIPAGEALARRLEKTSLFRNVWFVRQRELPEVRGKNTLDWMFFQHRRRYKTLRPLLPFDLDDYGDIYIFHDGTPLGEYLNDAGRHYHLIEDSLNFYQRIFQTPQAQLLTADTLKNRVRRLLNSGYFPLDGSRYVTDVEVNENAALQLKLPRVKELSRSGLQERLTDGDKAIVLDVFGCPDLERTEGRKALVLTEPFYEDGTCGSLEEQTLIYRNIVGALKNEGYAVMIKPHPRDGGDYAGCEAQILDRYFPIELLQFFPEMTFDCAVTVSSSAIYELQADRKLIWKSGALHELER